MPQNGDRRPWVLAIRLGLIIAVVSAAAWLVHSQGLSQTLHREWIDEHVLGHGVRGWLLFIGLTGVLTAVGVPRQVPSFLAGYAFGALPGTALAAIGTVLGSACSLFTARLLGRGVLPERLLHRMRKVEALLCEEPLKMAVAIRFLPIGNNLATNLIAGVSRVPAPRFLLGSLVGFLPQTLIFALMGKGFRVDPVWRVGTALVLLVVSTWIGRRMYRNFRRRQKARRVPEASPAFAETSLGRDASRTS